ncbi:MAG: RlmE family RNA methyltransferase [Candidatus Bathyarchaeia archaeon]|nr:RlmE family RNA methyltransferase [Candidatus Bathyarchaeota archaeon A05DMB-4]MDH7595838.1 RlmE family RNA methyltransferase [Candidatus Bathyarchaeota archaeon]
MPKTWLKQHRRDYYYKKAKEEQYRSRAAYKLLQAINKYHFMKLSDIVVDLGAAPGGWLQVSSRVVGEEGIVLGVDIKEVEPLPESNVCTIIGDIIDQEIINQIQAILPRPVDVVISDVSPNLSGVWELDHARQIDLARRSLQIALAVLRQGGNFFVKTFQGEMLGDLVTEIKNHFVHVEIFKPPASRAKSAEIYVLGVGLKTKLV